MLRAMASDATSFFPTSFFDGAQHRAARWLAAWDTQGIHRTATAGDRAGAANPSGAAAVCAGKKVLADNKTMTKASGSKRIGIIGGFNDRKAMGRRRTITQMGSSG